MFSNVAEARLMLLHILLLSALVEAIETSKKCHHNLFAPHGTINTQKYPDHYPPNYSCIWTIIAPAGYFVELTIIDFDVEPYDDCQTDMLEIKDGEDKAAPLIGILVNSTESLRDKGGQYCNKRRPPKVLTSTHNALRLWFSSDSTIELKGFKATYRMLKEEECGGAINASYGEIVTPRFPLHYPRDRKCEWKIKVPKGKFVALKFLFFELETSCPVNEACRCSDSVSITDGHSNDAKQLGTYCFRAPPPLVTSGNELSIKFASDLYGRLQGFKAIFTQSSTERCGGDYFVSKGTIESPNFDLSSDATYPAFSSCVWTITANRNEYVSVKFLYLDVKKSRSGGCEDFVEIRDGNTTTSPLLGKFCNMYTPDVLMSSDRTMFIRFLSTDKNNGKGFQISFTTHKKSCTESLGLEDGRIPKGALTVSSTFKIAHEPYELSADYGRLNGVLAWCSQEHEKKLTGEYFEIDFKKLTQISKIATQGYSMYGNEYYVTKYKLLYSTGTSLQHYAGAQQARKGILYTLFDANRNYNETKENKLSPAVVAKVIRILPLDYHSGKRMHVCMRVEVYGCKVQTGDSGTVLTKATDTLEYSSYKKSVNKWIISPGADTRNSVYLFRVLTLNADCTTSSLRISSDGHTHSANQTYCDSKKPDTVIQPASQQLWIIFGITKLPSTFQGFQFTYKLEDLGFGRTIASQHGVINGVHDILCRLNRTSIWLFQLPKGNRINLEFRRVKFPKRGSGAFLLVKAGLLDSSHVIRRLSRSEPPSAFVYSKNELRIEYHPGHATTCAHHRRAGFVLKYSAWKGRISSEYNHRW